MSVQIVNRFAFVPGAKPLQIVLQNSLKSLEKLNNVTDTYISPQNGIFEFVFMCKAQKYIDFTRGRKVQNIINLIKLIFRNDNESL